MRLVLAIIIALQAFCAAAQYTDSSDLLLGKEDYLILSRQQRTIGTIAVFTGSVTMVLGGFTWVVAPVAGAFGGTEEFPKRIGRTMVLVGCGLIASGVYLFHASKKSKAKAMLYTGTSSVDVPVKGSPTQLVIGLRLPIR